MKDSEVIEGVQCYCCGKIKGIDRSLYFDGKHFCTRQCELRWARQRRRNGELMPKDTTRKPRRIKPAATKPKKKQEVGWFDWLFGSKKKSPNIPKAYRR